MRDRIAAALLLSAAAVCIGLAVWFGLWSLAASTVPLAFAIAYALVAFGILRSRPWARWIGMGLALSGVGSFLLVLPEIGFYLHPAVRSAAALGHLAAFALLARRDDTPWQIRASWMLAGVPLLPLLFTGIDAFFVTRLDGNASPLALVAVPLAIVSMVALARSRTWGLLGVSLGGMLLCFAQPSVPYQGQVVMLMTSSMLQLVALVLFAVVLPFAAPIYRWMRHDWAD